MSYDRLTQESPVDTNITRLAQAFPSVVREGKVDFDALRQLLGDDIGEQKELFGLNWKGKAQARRAALTPSLGTLRPCPEESVDWDSTKNLYIEGDNLEVLKLLQKSYSGKVKMIYIDPPYNTGKEFVYPDDYMNNLDNYIKITHQSGKFKKNQESNGRFHTDWLNMMYPRLAIAKELLSNDGVIFISIDDNEAANLGQLCDEIFGSQNFVAQIVWEKVHTRKNSAIYFSSSHDYLICYAKLKRKKIGDSSGFKRNLLPREDISAYSNPDNDPKGPWKSDPITAHNYYAADYKIVKPNGVVLSRPMDGYWRYSKETIDKMIAENAIIWGEGDSMPMAKRYLCDVQNGLVPTTLFSREFAGDSSLAKKDIDELFPECKGIFDYTKPLKLMRRLLQIASGPSDIILDFFSGSATTAQAVMQMNAEDGGKRRHIMVQLPEPCKADTLARQAGYKNICEIGKERIRRAGKKLKEEAGLIGQGLDTGFRVYKLDSSNVKPWDPDAEDLGASLDLFSDHLVEGRTSDDLLTEVMLKSGIDLCEEMETREIAGHRVYSLGYGQFYACMDLDLSGAEGELALGIAAWHAEECAAVGGEQQDTCTVFVADQAFAGRDDAKVNFVSTLQQYGICKVKAL